LILKNTILAVFLLITVVLLAACGGTSSSTIPDSTGTVENQDSSNAGADASSDQSNPRISDDSESPESEPKAGADDAAEDFPDQPEQSFAGDVPAPEFPDGLDWLNTSAPLTLADLRGKVVVLDFWTYGCINCLHVIPELRALEEKYADELVVIGVHSAKFENEGETENIERIIQRYELEHPVVNDRQFQIWSQYGVRAWPTLVIIDPEGKVLGYHAGEGIYDRFDFIIGSMISQFDEIDRIDRSPLSSLIDQDRQVDSPLLFPGKVLADVKGDRIFIADSNHNRIVIADLQGNVREVVGDGQSGLQDGNFESASFFRPQGLTLRDENSLYVADTENNTIRLVDLVNRTVETVAGTGEQIYMTSSEVNASTSALNFPWDVLYHDGFLYVAMAGQHQIWSLDPDSGTLEVYAGSGREELKDGALLEGGLNQPSGLSTDGSVIYIADSEASAIRTATIDEKGRLETIVGTGLFDFGDVDGSGNMVRLQHPLGVAYNEGQLYVADTYNSKIKIIDPVSQESTTYLGGSESGWRDGSDALFDEPGGLSVGDDKLYIADTNNHVIRIADLDSGDVSTLVLIDTDGLMTRQPAGSDYTGKIVDMDPQYVATGPGTLTLAIEIPQGYKVNDLAPFSMEWSVEGDVATFNPQDSDAVIVDPDFPMTIPVEFTAGEGALAGELVIYYCENDSQSLCLIERVRINAPVIATDEGDSEVVIEYAIPAPPI